MLVNYLKLAVRILLRNPFMTFINIAGLSVGLATFMMLWPLAEFELSSDKYHKDADRILHIGVDFRWMDDNQEWDGFLGGFNWIGVIDEMEKTFGQVEGSTWIVPQADFRNENTGFNQSIFVSVIKENEIRKSFRETNGAIGAANLFEFFTIPLVRQSDSKQLLSKPDAVVLSQKIAIKYFGDHDAVGQTIYLNDTIPLQVTGVFVDLPHNSHLNFDFVISGAGYEDIYIKRMSNTTGNCYLKLKEGSTIESFNAELAPQQKSLYSFVKEDCAHCDITAKGQKLTDTVFSKWRGGDSNKYKSKFLLEALALVAFTVLAFAWINYISLSVNALNKRLDEIATRKSVGAGGNDFLAQFLVESLLMNVISFGIALTLVQFVSRIAENWFGFYIPSWSEISVGTSFITLATLGIGVGIATVCPLILIIRRKPTDLFKRSRSSIRSAKLGTTLVTIQYSVATILLVWIGVVYFQLNFLLNKDIGIQKEGLIVVDGPMSMSDANIAKMSSMLNEAKKMAGVIDATSSFSTMADLDFEGVSMQLPGRDTWFSADTNGGVDESFLNTFSIKLLAGRNFQADNPADEKSILISAAATRRFGFTSPEEAIGQNVLILKSGGNVEVRVVGIISDYEFRPYFSDVTERERGIVLTYKAYVLRDFKPFKMTFRIDLQRTDDLLKNIEALFQKTYQEPMKWSFLDEKLGMQYADERSTRNQLAFFSVLAVGITCLGLLGMISNKVIEKTKEIGIRKVLGARMDQIAALLLHTTVRQVVIANLVGIPLAYYLVQQYLTKFSERLEMTWWHYTVPALLLLIIMFATITSVLYKTARSNPVDALKYE